MTPTKQQALIAWIVWFAMLQTAFVYPFFLGDGFPSGENADEPMNAALWALCFGPILLAACIRWIVIPKLREPAQLLIAMIVGLALSESPILFSIFFMADYPQYQIAVLMVAIVSLIQFAPIYSTPGVKTESEETLPS